MGFAVEAAWCAHDQGKYFEYQKALYENQGQTPYNNSSLNDIAAELGLDQEQFGECLSNRVHRNDVENARQAAVRQGVNSTPTFFVNNQRLEGNQPYSVFQQIIEQELAIAQ
jgi:protein-disulfide isomerase